MPVTIPDSLVKQSGRTEREFLIEIACRLFEAEFLDQPDAAKLAELSRVEFELACRERGIAVVRITEEMLDSDLRNIERIEAQRAGRQ